MNLEKISNALNEYADSKQLNLFDVKYHKNDSTLSVTFDEQLSMEQIENISNEISELLDQYDDEFEDNYFLDVSTVGVERPIRNMEEVLKAIGSYVFVRDKNNQYYGDLIACDDNIIKLEVKDKTKTKIVEVDYKNVKEMRYAVRF